MSKYLPLGTVVLLKGAKTRLMICGRNHILETGRKFDYVGLIYPMGYMDKEKIFMFNEEQIESIFYVGYQDGFEFAYADRLRKEDLAAKQKGE